MNGDKLAFGAVAGLVVLGASRRGSRAALPGDTVWLLEWVDDDGELEVRLFASRESAEYGKKQLMLEYFTTPEGHAMWWWTERLLGVGGPVDSRSWEEDTEDLGYGYRSSAPSGFRERRYPARRTKLGPALNEELDRRAMTRLIGLIEKGAHPNPWDSLEEQWQGLSDHNVYVYSLTIRDPHPSIRRLKE
jgi:hypothetical protein